jgi:antitoxin ChpS
MDAQPPPATANSPPYTLDELIAECDPDAPLNDEDREWLSANARGSELL